ncbi:MAG: TfoX/Sxy family protein [Christensenellales bacterium]
MQKLSDMPNIGSVAERELMAVGICTPQELKATGSRQAWLRLRAVDASACVHKLMALEGAVRGVRRHLLPPEVKDELRAFAKAHKQ